MSKNNENKLVPRLRFPEFLKEGNWEDKILKQVSDVTSGQSPSGESYNEEGIGTPFYQGKTDFGDIFLKEPTKWTTEPTKFANADEILMSVRAPVGALNISTQKICIGRGLAAIQPKVNKWFLYYFLSRIKDRIIGNGGSVFDSINKEQIEKISVLIPQEQKEQQKIAACLSSLDDVINAESKKLEVLKEHKKGLLQNLFPQEGETVPKLRFKEFEDSGEWEVKKLGDIGVPLMCKRIFKEETTTNSNDGVPFYKIGTFGRLADSYISKEIYEEYKSKYSFPKDGDILISASGTIGRLVIYDGTPAYFQDSNIIWLGHNEEKILNKFLFYCYSNLKWQTSDGGVISRLYNSDFIRMTINFPEKKEEQQKIASCLSSLDDLINAQSQKIETLKLHKKGLLQGLFPDVNEHNG